MGQILEIVFMGILIVLALLQLSLALGFPLGKFAWGGQHKILPRPLRIASAASIFIYLVFITIYLSKSGSFTLIKNEAAREISFLIMSGYFTIGIFMNAVSRSKHERLVMTPTIIILFICCFYLLSK